MKYELDVVRSSPIEQRTSVDLVKLIRKLRWVGLEDEAHQLQVALNQFPPDVRPVVCEPLATD